MANEYLKRTYTSTGNLKVGTFSFWIKGRPYDTNQTRPVYLYDGSNLFQVFVERTSGTNPGQIVIYGASADIRYKGIYRDPSAWSHYLIKVDNTTNGAEARFEVYVNGVKLEIVGSQSTSTASYPARDANVFNNVYYINGTGNGAFQCCDYFFVDGQALTPDVFGFYKDGNGYISAGSTQSTDFRPGQWVPKTPRIIKAQIERNGGFGVNGFYLPMNDSSNFGADFHTTPNSIITLKGEDLPQPRNGAPTTTDAYVSQLRTDPYAANLVLALPFVSGGLSSGFGDYAPNIKGSGTPKTMSSGSVSIASTAGYYGTAANFQNSNSYVDTPGTSGDFNMGTGDFTIEGWFYPTGNGGNARLFGQNTNTYNAWDVYIDGSSATGQLYMMGSAYQLTTASIRGNQWNHVAISRKNLVWTTYINGVAAGIVTSIVNNTVGDSTNKFRVGAIGENAYGGVGYSFQGYIQDFRVYKGVAKYTGGFDVPRPYTPVGIGTWRAVPDTTANNFATMNPLIGATPRSGGTITSTIVTYTDGNLTTRNSANGGYAPSMQSHSNVGMTTGKWYWEVSNFSTTNNEIFGISKGNEQGSPTGNGTGIESLISFNSPVGTIYIGGQSDTTGSITPASGTISDVPGNPISSTSDVVGFAFDAINSSLSVYLNGVLNNTVTNIVPTQRSVGLPWVASKTASTSGTASGMSWNFGQNPTFSGNTTAGTFTDSNGKGLFKYQPPSGFLALCEDNLPTPAIKNPGEYFKAILYQGDSTVSKEIKGVGFQPDLIFFKNRTDAVGWNIFDSVRGPAYQLSSNTTGAEVLRSGGGCWFNEDGFTVSSNANNNNPNPYVAYCWRAGAGTTSTNTNGSITSVVSVNQDAGFSIATYTGTGSALTFGHGLGKVPAFAIFKYRSGPSGGWTWVVYHKSLPTNYYVYLQSTVTQQNLTGVFTTAPTSTLFSLGTEGAVNTNNNNMVCYSWAEIEGFSKFGSYVGNGSADGPFVYCGFKPALVIFKRTDSTDNWRMNDNARGAANGTNFVLYPNLSNIEDQANDHLDYLSNGFKLRGTNNNASGGSYIFAAWAESPINYSNSK